jgi:5-hydroxyisourate hydrolase
MQLTLTRIDGTVRQIAQLSLNDDGRTPAPLLADPAVGRYRLVFAVGDYFRALGTTMPEPPFLDQVPIEFGIADPAANYHVPLLVSPWSYSTYRGS